MYSDLKYRLPVQDRVKQLREDKTLSPIDIIKIIRKEYSFGLKEAKESYDNSFTEEEKQKRLDFFRKLIELSEKEDL